jgi:Flp pilus assembly protein TadB
MEFEELQKIWVEEKQETVYAINESALHQRIIAKNKSVQHITNLSEWGVIIVNSLCGGIVIAINYWNSKQALFLYIMAAWMILTSIYVLVSRRRRLQATPRFDRTMREELQHAVATATYQVRLSQLMRLNIIPIAALCVAGIWHGGKLIWQPMGILLFFGIAYYYSGWEHRIYKRKKRELEVLQNKLNQE